MSAPVRVLLLGYGHLGLALLQGLLETPGCEVVGVYRWSVRKKGQSGWEPQEAQFARLCKKHRLLELDCGSVNGFEFSQQVRALNPDLVLIGSWGEILKSHLLGQGLYYVNCHPSLLPKHRGANPYVSAIRAGETETGISFHHVSEGVDAGPVLVQGRTSIGPEETGVEVRDRCARLVRQLVPEVIKLYHSGELAGGEVQDETDASYFGQLKMEDGQIHWETDTPQSIDRQIRALYPWLPSFCFAEGRVMLSVVRARLCPKDADSPAWRAGQVVRVKKGAVYVATSDPKTWMALQAYRFYVGVGFLPAWLCRWMAPALLKPGTRLGLPYWQQPAPPARP